MIFISGQDATLTLSYVMTILVTTRLPAFSIVETKVYTEYLTGLNLQLPSLLLMLRDSGWIFGPRTEVDVEKR